MKPWVKAVYYIALKNHFDIYLESIPDQLPHKAYSEVLEVIACSTKFHYMSLIINIEFLSFVSGVLEDSGD